jgi:catechol 2,3-dioxygenase-like lactoylglutathione lyase family enzyme
MYRLSGVHHVAIGLRSLEKERLFYRDVLNFNRVFAEFPDTEHLEMSEVVRDPRPAFAPVLLSQEAGGIIVELIRMTNPLPRPIRQDFRYGDIGVNKLTIAVGDFGKLCQDLKGRIDFCSRTKSVRIPGWGEYQFIYGRDLEGNLIELVASPNLPVEDRFGGVRWVGIGVTDLDRSIAFYQKYAGLDSCFIRPHESFSGLVDEISGGKSTGVRSCVLASSRGEGMVELFEVRQPRGRSIPFATRWGDFGYLQVCFTGQGDMEEIAGVLEKNGLEFFCRPQIMGDEPPGSFIYLKDPDGIPVEYLIFLK